jgi:hypothetical protein
VDNSVAALVATLLVGTRSRRGLEVLWRHVLHCLQMNSQKLKVPLYRRDYIYSNS